MNIQPLISIVILTYNKKEDTFEMLSELKYQTYKNTEIIVVDNNSTDGIDNIIEEEFKDIKIIRLHRNFGVAQGRNIGIKNSKGKIIVFIDNDGILDRNALMECYKEFKNDERLGVITGKVINYYTKELSYKDWVHPYNPGEWQDKEFYSPIFVGGCCAIRKDIIDKIGYFPDEIFRQEEEADISYRIIDSGYKIKYSPSIVFYHKKSAESKASDMEFFHSTKNNLSVIWKYLPLTIALKQTIIKLVVLGLKAVKKGYFISYIKGIFAFVASFPLLLKNRKKVKKETITKLKYMWKSGYKPIYKYLW